MEMKLLSPILWTKSIKETISFYETVLGFKSQSNFPNFASVTRDSIEIMFIVPQDEPEDCKDPNNKEEFFPKPVLTGSIYIVVKDVNKIWEMVKDKAIVKTAIEDREYHMRDFSIFDNNGYELCFGEHLPD